MPQKPPDKRWDPEGYAIEQARRMRAARLRDEAYARRWHRAWAAERARPIGQRRYFSFAEIAEQLARDPHSLATHPKLRERIAGDLAAWVQNRQFASGEVVTLSGDPPDFRPFQLTPDAILVPDAEVLALRRGACRRYAEARAELTGAAGLLHDWFAAEAATANTADPPQPGAARTGSKGVQQQTSKQETTPKPQWQRRRGPEPTKDKIITDGERLFGEGQVPPDTIPWKQFAIELCTNIGVNPDTRGYGLDTIQKALRPLIEERRARRLNSAATENAESTDSTES